jgi:hypothetical protein
MLLPQSVLTHFYRQPSLGTQRFSLAETGPEIHKQFKSRGKKKFVLSPPKNDQVHFHFNVPIIARS